MLIYNDNDLMQQDMRWLWRLPLPARWIYFLWLVWKGRLVTNSYGASWVIGIEARCSMCDSPVEYVIYVLRDCEFAVGLWKQVIPRDRWGHFFGATLQDWLWCNLDVKSKEIRTVVRFVTTAWRIWTRRCSFVFEPDEPSISECDLIRNINVTTREVLEVWYKQPTVKSNASLIHWSPTPQSKVKVNTDGASRGNPGIAGAGGVIRDANGKWLVGFAAHLGIASNMAAELHALRMGLILAWDEGFRDVICEMDALVILELNGCFGYP